MTLNKLYKGICILLWIMIFIAMLLYIANSPLIKNPEMLMFACMFNIFSAILAWRDEEN